MLWDNPRSDLAGELVVDGETYGCVKCFCYLGDGEADLDIQSSPARDDMSSVCHLCQK